MWIKYECVNIFWAEGHKNSSQSGQSLNRSQYRSCYEWMWTHYKCEVRSAKVKCEVRKYRQVRNRTWQHYSARRANQIIPYVGRVSTDRSMEAALLDTTPLWVNKSYTSDLVARHWNQSDPARQSQGVPPRDKVINRAYAVIRKPLRVTSQHREAIISLQWLDRILT